MQTVQMSQRLKLAKLSADRVFTDSEFHAVVIEVRRQSRVLSIESDFRQVEANTLSRVIRCTDWPQSCGNNAYQSILHPMKSSVTGTGNWV